MFVRFVCAEAHPSGVGELGMFTAREQIDFAKQPGQIQRAHEEAFYWFSPTGAGGLRYPKLSGRVRNSAVRKSLFWFREDASFWGAPRGSVVERARRLAEVITLAGVEIRELRTSDPGEIIWQDIKQVLALPKWNSVPRAFGNGSQPPRPGHLVVGKADAGSGQSASAALRRFSPVAVRQTGR